MKLARILLASLLLAGAALHAGAADDGPAHEARGFWLVSSWYLHEPVFMDFVVDKLAGHHMNLLFVQAVARGQANYTSALLPRHPELPEGVEPLAYLPARARERGVEVHAWMNTFVVGPLRWQDYPADHLLARHPDWVTYDQDGRTLLDYTGQEPLASQLEGYYLDPALPEVQAFLAKVARELVSRHDLDGLHLDYVRYPGRAFGYHPRVRELFQARHGTDPLELATRREALAARHGEARVRRWEQAWDAFRREQVTNLVRHISQAVRTVRPGIKLTAAVFADPADAFANRLQDWPAWLAEGLLDAVVPMAYSTDPAVVRSQIRAARAAAGSRHVYAGLGAYRLWYVPRWTVEMIEAARAAEPQGIILFSFNEVSTRPDFWDALREGPFQTPAGIPAMPWREPAQP